MSTSDGWKHKNDLAALLCLKFEDILESKYKSWSFIYNHE